MRACNYSLRSMMRRRRRFWAEWSAAGINSVTSASLVLGNKGARVRHARNERVELAISLGPALVGSGGRFVVLRSGEAYDAQARDPNRNFQFESSNQIN